MVRAPRDASARVRDVDLGFNDLGFGLGDVVVKRRSEGLEMSGWRFVLACRVVAVAELEVVCADGDGDDV